MVTEARPTPTPAPPFTVLVADDDRGLREALADVLKAQGFNPVLAADGGEAVEIVQVQLIHLVLFDMHMPRLTGLEALTLLRQTLDRVLPAVLMTADATTELLRQALSAQVYSVIPKPVKANVVVHTLARAIAQVYGPPPTTTPPAGGPTAPLAPPKAG
ncbi:MAG TPA: response regulator [Urbifossiella sp.]|nr:response regulator [Urbifossiella sp.]